MEEEQLSPEIYQLLSSGHKIGAIKMIRQETGLGLAEAKELAEVLSGQQSDSGTQQQQTLKEEGGASGMLAIVVAAVIAFVVYVFFVAD